MLEDLHYLLHLKTMKLSNQDGVILLKDTALSNQKLLDSYLVPYTKINSELNIINEKLNYKTLARKQREVLIFS